MYLKFTVTNAPRRRVEDSPRMMPARAFLYSPFTSLSSHTSRGVSTNTSKNGRLLVWCRLRARSRSYKTYHSLHYYSFSFSPSPLPLPPPLIHSLVNNTYRHAYNHTSKHYINMQEYTRHKMCVVYYALQDYSHAQPHTRRYGDMNDERTTMPASANSLATSEILRMFSSRSSGLNPRFLFRP